jgi:hypothetical protein
MPREQGQTWTHTYTFLPNTGPKRVGNQPAATDPPGRTITRNPVDGTNSRVIARPAQGQYVGQDLLGNKPAQ